MEHRGIDQIIQTLSRSEWKWVVYLTATKTKSGTTGSKQRAIEHATRTIDNATEADVRARYRDGKFA
jgi:hypothetical protein